MWQIQSTFLMPKFADWTVRQPIIAMRMKKSIFTIVAIAFVTIMSISLCSWTFQNSNDATTCSHSHSQDWTCDQCDGSGHSRLSCRSCQGKGMIKRTTTCDYYGCNNGTVYDQYGNPQKCMMCNGTGRKTYEVSCNACGGWGKTYCTKCGGTGRVGQN